MSVDELPKQETKEQKKERLKRIVKSVCSHLLNNPDERKDRDSSAVITELDYLISELNEFINNDLDSI